MRKIILLVMISITLMGCASTIKGRAERFVDIDVIKEDVNSQISIAKINQCNLDKTKECRNNIIYATMLGSDVFYHEFQSKLVNNDRDSSFIAKVVTIGLNAAGAYTGASIYSAISAGLIGSEAAYESTMLQNQMIDTLLIQMSAQRNVVKARILQQCELTFEEYPLNLASLDLESYYSAGSLISAMKSLSASASTNAANANNTLKAVNPSSAGNKE